MLGLVVLRGSRVAFGICAKKFPVVNQRVATETENILENSLWVREKVVSLQPATKGRWDVERLRRSSLIA